MKQTNYNNSKVQRRIPFVENNQSTTSDNTSKYSNNKLDNIFSNLSSLTARFDKLEQDNIKFRKQLQRTIERENKLLNRFCWLLRIINWSSVIIMIIISITFINSLYPFLKKLMEDDIGIRVVITTVGGVIGAAICGLWWTFNKYVNKVIEREQKNKEQ